MVKERGAALGAGGGFDIAEVAEVFRQSCAMSVEQCMGIDQQLVRELLLILLTITVFKNKKTVKCIFCSFSSKFQWNFANF